MRLTIFGWDIAGQLCRRFAIRPHIGADGSATLRCPVCRELFTIETVRLRKLRESDRRCPEILGAIIAGHIRSLRCW